MKDKPILEDLHGSAGSSEESDNSSISGSQTSIHDAAEQDEAAIGLSSTMSLEPGELDVLGNGLLRKRVVREGRGRDSRPTQGERVTVRCVAWLESNLQQQVECHEALHFTLGDGDVNQALDLCVALMELAEVAEIRCDARYAYGSYGLPSAGIPGQAALRYELELLRVDDALDVSQMSTGEQFAAADAKRARGNDLFDHEEYAMAINSYSKALRFVESHAAAGCDTEMQLEHRTLMARIYNNLAASQLKIEAFDAVLVSCERVLAVEINNVKALFRRGRALAAKGELMEALVSLRHACSIEPDNRLVLAERRRVENELRETRRTSQALYRKMLGLNEVKNTRNLKVKRWWNSYAWTAVACMLVAVSVSLATAAYKYNLEWSASVAAKMGNESNYFPSSESTLLSVGAALPNVSNSSLT